MKTKKKEQELTRLGGALRALGGLGGRFLGSAVGMGDAGGFAGTSLGASLSRWLGSGDYTVNSNSIVKRSQASPDIPAMHRNDQVITVRHKEFVCEVSGSIAYTVQRQFSLNPGVAGTFPWLSQVAAQYTEYRIKGMVYHYIPTSGDAVASTNAALGSVMLQTSYRANEPAPTSKVELLNEFWASEGKPSVSFVHPIECDPKENPFNIQYVRTSAVAATDNILLYDLGTTTLATSGQQIDSGVLGDLWVTYEIELRKPRLSNFSGDDTESSLAVATSNINSTTPMGTNVVLSGTYMNGSSVSSTAFTVGAGNVGVFQMTLVYQATTAATFTSMAISGSGSAVYRIYGSTNPRATALTTGTGNMVVYTFQITNPNTTTVLTPAFSVLTGATGMYCHVTRINPSATF